MDGASSTPLAPPRPIRLIGAAPAPSVAEGILKSFANGGIGTVTAFSDGLVAGLTERAGAAATLDVVAFPKLVSTAADLTNSPSRLVASRSLAVAAVRAACRALGPASPFFRVAGFSGFHRAFLNTLATLHEHRIDAERLRSAVFGIADPDLRAKILAMADLDEDAHARLEALGRSTLTRQISRVIDEEPDSDEVVGRLLVFGGGEFSPRKLDLLTWFARQGAEVTLVMDAPSGGDARLFAALDRTAEELGVRPERLTSPSRLLTGLFSPATDAPEGLELSGGVRIESAGDELAECEWALRHIAAAPEIPTILLARNMETYAPLLEVAARRLGVPVNVHRTEPLLANGLARTFLGLLESLEAPHPRDLAEILECRYFDLPRAVRERLKAMVAGDWDDFPPRRPEEPEEGFDWLQALLDLRRVKAEGRTFRDWTEPVLALLAAESWSLPETQGATQDGAGGAKTPESRDGRALKQTRKIVFDRVALDGDDETVQSYPAFVADLRAMLADADVYVPAPQGATPVVSDPGEVLGDDRVIALGLLEGVFPRRQREDAVLSDEERAALSAALPDVPRLPHSGDEAARERDRFYRLCALPRRELVLTYPRTAGDRDNVRAFYLDALERAHPVTKVDRPRKALVPDPAERRAAADRALGTLLDERPAARFDETIAGELARESARDAVASASMGELMRLRECPFRFVLRHKFRVFAPRAGDGGDEMLRGLATEARLLNQPDRDAARDALEDALERGLAERARVLSSWDRRSLRARGEKAVRELLDREFAAREMWRGGEGEPVYADVAPTEATDGLKSACALAVELGADAVGERGGVPVLYYNDAGKPIATSDANAEESEARLEFRSMLLWGANGKCREPLIVEIDSVGGQRARLTFNLTDRGATPTRGALIGKDMGRILGERAEGEKKPRWGVLFEDFRERLTAARAGEIATRPGAWCERCEYKDLCRNSLTDKEDPAP